MKNTKLFFFLLAVSLLLTCFGPIFAENPTLPTQNKTPLKCNFGYKLIATPTFDINDVTVTSHNDYIPAGTIGFKFRVKSGSLVTCHGGNIATGTDRVGELYAEGETFQWNGLAGTFIGKMLSNLGTSTIVIDAVWGEWSDNDDDR